MTSSPHRILQVYVPQPASDILPYIAQGSGIVGERATPVGSDKLLIYFEGNLYGAENLNTYREKVRHAAGRLLWRAPTIAKMIVAPDDLVLVGSYDYDADLLTVQQDTSSALIAWAGDGWWADPTQHPERTTDQ